MAGTDGGTLRMHYSEAGSGEPVVLLHGSMASKEQWGSLARKLSKKYRVITLDLLGYGRSPLPGDPEKYDLARESRHVEETLNEIGLHEPYHVIGHSYGGAIALFHGFTNQARVKSLTLYEPMAFHLLKPAHPLLLESYEMAQDIREDIQAGNSLVGAKKFIDLWLPAGTFDRTTEMEKKILSLGVQKMVHDFRAAATAPVTAKDYSGLTIPTCLLAGEESPSYSFCIADVVASILPKVEPHTVEGGHVGLFTHPFSTTPIILDFLEKQQSPD